MAPGPPNLRKMDPGPPYALLLLASVLHVSHGAQEQPLYIIDTVGLSIQPGGTVESGTPVTLICQVGVSHDNVPNLMHTFRLTRNDIPIDTAQSAADKLVYALEPARAADSGIYECQVTVRDKSKTSYSQNLNVTGLQTPALNLSRVELYEGDNFVATCSAPEEKGSLSFSFFRRFRNEEPQMMKQVASAGNSSTTTLVLRHVGNYFLFCNYEMNLVSGTRRSRRSNEIQVLVSALNISPVMNVLPASAVFEGELIEVVCKVVGSQKSIEVFLTKDRRVLKKALVSLSHRFRAQEGDSGELVCKAEWGNVQKETYKIITVKELFSKPRLTVEPLDMFEGDHLEVTCRVTVHVPERIGDETLRYSIYRDGVRVAESQTYAAARANPGTNGNYTCRVKAVALDHSFLKESPTIVVKAKIPVSKPVLSVVGGTLVLGRRFRLLCRSRSGTLPIMYTLNGPAGLIGVNVVSRPGQEAVFNSSAVLKSSDLNNFICRAQNSQNHPAEVGAVPQLLRSTNIIEPVSKPAFAIDPNMGDVSEGQDLTLSCSVQRGTPPVTFAWYHRDAEAPLATQTSLGKLEGSHLMRNVRAEQNGEYYCASTNPANDTKHSHALVVRVKLASWKKGLIAALCIVLALALVLVVVFKRRLLRFKREAAAELSVKSASTKVERLSLTQAEVNEAANVTPGMMGKSVWSEHLSGSESDDQISEAVPEPQYSEVKIRGIDPNRGPVKKGTDTVYSEVRTSTQGVPEQPESQDSVEYVELNHDTDHHGACGDQSDPVDPADPRDPGHNCVHNDHIDVADTNAGDDGAE